jgi:hypothetical protein
MFFDNLILAKNLPIIDYGITFDRHLGLSKDFILQKCNQHDDILVPVHVCDEASSEARDAAIATLKNKTEVPRSLTTDLVRDMKSLEHQWHPDLSPLGEIPEQDLPLVRFLYGATVFGVFARNAGVGHLFQPNRSRPFLAAALHADSETAQDDQLLYAKLKQIMTEAAGGADVSAAFDGFPPFLPLAWAEDQLGFYNDAKKHVMSALQSSDRDLRPSAYCVLAKVYTHWRKEAEARQYLLRQNPPTPGDLISEAFALRDTGMVRDYRALRMELISD